MFNIVNMNEKEKHMPVKDYADKKGISVQAVYQMIKRGNLEFKKIGSYTLIKCLPPKMKAAINMKIKINFNPIPILPLRVAILITSILS